MTDFPFSDKRQLLVDNLRNSHVIKSEEVYEAMLQVPRHQFVSKMKQPNAYYDTPLQIGEGQTISAPHMNAMMCEYLSITPGQKILEIGTGSGYHAALLGLLVGKNGQVFTMERFPKLANKAKGIFLKLGYSNIEVIVKDGTLGYKKEAPFDRILVTAAGPEIPQALLNQLSPHNGIMCIPVGQRRSYQKLLVINKNGDQFEQHTVCSVIFVPLIGEQGFSN
jgi:protein-L-isoaspartate(D-aspartate) O-methyltransferase